MESGTGRGTGGLGARSGMGHEEPPERPDRFVPSERPRGSSWGWVAVLLLVAIAAFSFFVLPRLLPGLVAKITRSDPVWDATTEVVGSAVTNAVGPVVTEVKGVRTDISTATDAQLDQLDSLQAAVGSMAEQFASQKEELTAARRAADRAAKAAKAAEDRAATAYKDLAVTVGQAASVSTQARELTEQQVQRLSSDLVLEETTRPVAATPPGTTGSVTERFAAAPPPPLPVQTAPTVAQPPSVASPAPAQVQSFALPTPVAPTQVATTGWVPTGPKVINVSPYFQSMAPGPRIPSGTPLCFVDTKGGWLHILKGAVVDIAGFPPRSDRADKNVYLAGPYTNWGDTGRNVPLVDNGDYYSFKTSSDAGVQVYWFDDQCPHAQNAPQVWCGIGEQLSAYQGKGGVYIQPPNYKFDPIKR